MNTGRVRAYAGWLAGWLVGWLAGWLVVGWWVGRLVCWLRYVALFCVVLCCGVNTGKRVTVPSNPPSDVTDESPK